MKYLLMAAALSFSPASVAVAPGQSFSIALYVDPENATIYTVRANLSFDPSLLSLSSFSFAPNWIQLSEPGYDLIDNANGNAAKTAGMPGGIMHETELGVATFVAKNNGIASITTTNDSFALDASSTNEIHSEAIASVQIGAGAMPAPSPAVVVIPAAAPAPAAPSVSTVLPPAASTTPPASQNLQTASALSGFDAALTLGGGSPLAASALTAFAILLLALLFRLMRRRAH